MLAVKDGLIDQAEWVTGMHPGVLGPLPRLVGGKAAGNVGGEATVEGIVGAVENVYIVITTGHRASLEPPAGSDHPHH